MDIHRAFEILDLNENASEKEIKEHYRDLVSIWHPDHHIHNQRLYIKAQEKLKDLNVAYDTICSFLVFKKVYSDNYSEKDETENKQNYIIIPCKHCGSNNRVKISQQNYIYSCGKCGERLSARNESENQKNSEERILCGDDKCIGTIGKSGRCNYCGKTLSEGKNATEKAENKEKNHQQQKNKKEISRGKRKKIIKVSLFILVGISFLILYINAPSKISQKKIIDNSAISLAKNEFSPKNNITQPPIKKIKLRPPRYDVIEFNYDDFFSIELFNNLNINIEDRKLLQKLMKALGYDVGSIDGIIGERTINSFKKFSMDYSFIPDPILFPKDFVSELLFHVYIKSKFPDWKTIYMDGDFENWINQLPNVPNLNNSDKYFRNVKIISVLLCKYEFEKLKPPPLTYPKNGIIKKSFVEGVAPLKITTKYEDQNYYIKLVDINEKKEIVTAFIRGGTTMTIEVPIGSCEMKTAAGKTWYGEPFLFGPSSIYSKVDKIFNFRIEGNQVAGYSIELFLQPHGNLKTEEISEFEF